MQFYSRGWFVAVRPTLSNLARGVAKRTDSASWGKFPQLLSPPFVVTGRRIAAVSWDLGDIFVPVEISDIERMALGVHQRAFRDVTMLHALLCVMSIE